jgi:ribosomal protein L37AE/L43A
MLGSGDVDFLTAGQVTEGGRSGALYGRPCLKTRAKVEERQNETILCSASGMQTSAAVSYAGAAPIWNEYVLVATTKMLRRCK